MSQLAPIKQKIESIKKTKKITHAVRLVSMSSYSRLEKQNLALQHYKKSINNLFLQLLPDVPNWESPILFPEDILDTNPLVIIISSASGLCGSFNSNLFKYFHKAYFIEEHQIPRFVTIGQKANKFVKENELGEIIDNYKELTISNLINITDALVDKITNPENNFSSVTFYSNFLKNFFIQIPQKKSLIPMTLEKEKTETDATGNPEFIWEQDKTQIINYVSTKYIKSNILDTIFQSLISENASRFIAMDSATTNAESLLEKLTLQYNKARQTLITREVAELSANL